MTSWFTLARWKAHASVVEFCALDGWKRDLIRLLSSTVENIDRIFTPS